MEDALRNLRQINEGLQQTQINIKITDAELANIDVSVNATGEELELTRSANRNVDLAAAIDPLEPKPTKCCVTRE